MWFMAGGGSLRRVADPVVAAPPSGVRIRTRIHVTEAEARALAVIGVLLGSVYRAELAARVRRGRMDRETCSAWRAERKQVITAMSSSRWAGAITRAVDDQYQLGLRGLAAHIGGLREAIGVLEVRCALRPGQTAPRSEAAAGGRDRPGRGYRSAAERFVKTRRLAALRARLATAEEALAAAHPSMVVGGKRLWRNRNNLEQAQMSEQQWRQRWDAARMFLTADGESGKAGGNETIRVDEAGRLRVKVAVALVDELGAHVVIATPVRFAHRGLEWAERTTARRAVRYDISFDPDRGRWYLDASWKQDVIMAPASIEQLRTGPVLGVDLNDGHLGVCVLDGSGNPVGEPATIEVATAGLRSSRRDGRVRAAITTLLDHAEAQRCAAVVMENLNFADARAAGRDTMGRGARGKRFRRTVAAIPTAKFRTRLTAMAARRGIAVIGVDAAYTSKWGNQHWRNPLKQQTSDPATVTRHHAAAAAIGRRGLGYAIRRRPAGPRTADRGPLRAHHRPGPTATRTTMAGTAAPAHRRAPEVHRSTGKHPPAAATTVRAAQDSLLLTN